MIKFDHVHEDGKVCLRSKSRHTFENMVMLEIKGKEYAVAYMSYTGQYYVYNPQSGKKVATITKEFYESIKHFQVGTITPDPNCKPRNP